MVLMAGDQGTEIRNVVGRRSWRLPCAGSSPSRSHSGHSECRIDEPLPSRKPGENLADRNHGRLKVTCTSRTGGSHALRVTDWLLGSADIGTSNSPVAAS